MTPPITIPPDVAGLATAAAFVLAAAFLWAAAAKLVRRRSTAAAFGALGVPRPAAAAVAVPAGELVVAAALVWRPAAGGVAAALLLGPFSTFLAVRVRQRGAVVCGCFGASSAEPVGAAAFLRNGFLTALALVALGASRPAAPALPELVAVTAATAMGAVLVAMVKLLARTGHLFANGVPGREEEG